MSKIINGMEKDLRDYNFAQAMNNKSINRESKLCSSLDKLCALSVCSSLPVLIQRVVHDLVHTQSMRVKKSEQWADNSKADGRLKPTSTKRSMLSSHQDIA